jgi:hypothetical protein
LKFVIAAVAIVAIAAACGPTRDSLGNEEAAQLRLAGSKEIAAGGLDAESGVGGQQAALTWRQYGVDAPWPDVVAYFDAEMQARGWQKGGGSSGLPSTSEWDAMAWHSNDRILRLGHIRNVPNNSGLFETFYEVALIGRGVPAR